MWAITQAVLTSQVGQTNVVYFRGNLAEAERRWRSILADTPSGTAYHGVMAQAEHGLGTYWSVGLQPQEGRFRTCGERTKLYQEESSQLRVLTDLGILMLRLGHVEDAERALSEVCAA